MLNFTIGKNLFIRTQHFEIWEGFIVVEMLFSLTQKYFNNIFFDSNSKLIVELLFFSGYQNFMI